MFRRTKISRGGDKAQELPGPPDSIDADAVIAND
jgi:hypothetical protein